MILVVCVCIDRRSFNVVMEDEWPASEEQEGIKSADCDWIHRACSSHQITAGLYARLTDPVSGLALAKGTIKQRLSVIKRFVEFYFAESGEEVATPEEVFGDEGRMKKFLGTMALRCAGPRTIPFIILPCLTPVPSLSFNYLCIFAFSSRSHGTSALSKAVACLSRALPNSTRLSNTIPLFLESSRKKAKMDYRNHRAAEMAKRAAASAPSPHHLLQERMRSDGHRRCKC